jgi:hypothetical protein
LKDSNRSLALSNRVSGVPSRRLKFRLQRQTRQMRPIGADFSRIPSTETGMEIPKVRK